MTDTTRYHRTRLLRGIAPVATGLAGLALLVGTSGCEPSWYDFRVYDDLADQTWTEVSEAPDNVGDQRYGWNIASGAVSDSGASFLVAGEKPDGFGFVRVDPAGAITTTAIPLFSVNILDQPNTWSARPAMAGSDGSTVAVSMSNGGSPAEPTQATVALIDAGTGQPGELFSLPGSDHVKDLAFGQTDVAGAGQNGLVALRFAQLGIIADIADPQSPVPSCEHEFTVPLGLEVAELKSDSPGQEIVFAAANGANPSQVMILSGSLVSDAVAAGLDPTLCFDGGRAPLVTIDAPEGESDFGSGLVVADFNNTGVPDLAIGAAGSGKVYVYTEIDLAGALPPTPIIVDGPPGAIGFGSNLYAGDVHQADGADELIVAIPSAQVSGQVTAGMVHVYDFGAGAFAAPIVLHDAQPEGDSQFGQGVAVVPFGPTSEILVVGAKSELFTYFRLHTADDDVRTGMTP